MKTKSPCFDVSPDDSRLIHKLAVRMVSLFIHSGVQVSLLECEMDLTAAHNSCPLDLLAMLNGSSLDLSHDLGGIRRHLNRRTGEIEGCFVPRFSKCNLHPDPTNSGPWTTTEGAEPIQ